MEIPVPHLSKTAGVSKVAGLISCNRREQEQVSAWTSWWAGQRTGHL